MNMDGGEERMSCENCGNPQPRRRERREYRYRAWGLPWEWMVCEGCADEQMPRMLRVVQMER